MSQSDSAQLVKTCQTCFHAKIRCDRTQDSGFCDRCLRLDKPCVFAPAKKRSAPVRRGADRLDRRDLRREARWSQSRATPDGDVLMVADTASTPSDSAPGASFDPFDGGLLSWERAAELLDVFRTQMTPHFPFVVVSAGITVQQLRREQPSLCLAVAAAASFGDIKLQRALGRLFNELISARLMEGKFATLDMLRALLVHLAWAHYLPRPRRVTQHLMLASSIVTDLRMDRPKNPEFWDVNPKRSEQSEWSADEMRALAGVYYLSSSISVLLQKTRHFYFAPYILQCCRRLAEIGEQPTDRYLPVIVQTQSFIDEVDDIASMASVSRPRHRPVSTLPSIREEFATLKASVGFALNESPTIIVQFQTLELLLNQSSTGASSNSTAFGLGNISDATSTAAAGNEQLVSWLSDSILAVQSLINAPLLLPSAAQQAMTNPEWIMLYCGLSMAARLDILAAHPGIARATRQLRRFLDMDHILKQTVLRLDSATSPDVDARGDRDAFFHLGRRAKRLQEWHRERCVQDHGSNSSNTPSSFSGAGSSMHTSGSAYSSGGNAAAAINIAEPSSMLLGTGQHNTVEFVPDLLAEYGSQLGLDSFSFTGPSEFFGFE